MDVESYRHIYGVLKIKYFIAKILGVAPYYIEKVNGKLYFYEGDYCNKFLVPFGLTCSMLCGTVMIVYDVINNSDTTNYEKMCFLFVHVQMCLAAVTSTVCFNLRIKKFLDVFRLLNEVDGKLTKMAVKVSFSSVYTYIICWFLVYMTMIPLVFSQQFFAPGPDWVFSTVAETLSFRLGFMMASWQIFYFYSVCVVLINRFCSLNDYLKQLNLERSKESRKYVEQKLLDVSGLHLDLCTVCKNMTYVNSFTILWNYLIAFEEISILFLYYCGVRLQGNYTEELYFWSFVFTLTLFCLINLTALVKYESGKTAEILCSFNFNISKDWELVQARDTFLLQLLHHRIEFYICGLFNMSLSGMLGHFSSITTAIMFLLQMTGNL